MRRIVILLLLAAPCLAQDLEQANVVAATPTYSCKPANPISKEVPAPNKGFIDLPKATAFIVDAINEARCQNYYPSGRFQLTTADIDFQTLIDSDGSIEVLFIGGVAGELDKQVTSDSDFTYSVPTPIGAVALRNAKGFLALENAKTKASPAKTLGEAIGAAIKQMSAGVGDLPALSQHQVKVSIKFAFTKDGTIELEPKFGSVGITAKIKKTQTTTQTLTLTFTDQVPVLNLSTIPSSPVSQGVPLTLVATVAPPANSQTMPTGKVTFLDGNTILDVAPLNGGFAEFTIASLASGAHSLTVVYGSDDLYDKTVSTATVIVVTPKVPQH